LLKTVKKKKKKKERVNYVNIKLSLAEAVAAAARTAVFRPCYVRLVATSQYQETVLSSQPPWVWVDVK